MKEKIAVVMPVYNEEAIIGDVVDKWMSFLAEMRKDTNMVWDLHLYNDGSRDNTFSILQEKASFYRENFFLHDKKNSGHGPTILLGYREAVSAGYDWIFQTDSDNEMEPDALRELWEKKDDFDLLTGARMGRKQTVERKLVSSISRLSVRFLLGKGPKDVNTPYRLMRGESFRELFEKLPSDTFAPNVILSGMAGNKKMRIFEMEVPQSNRTTGECSLGNPWKLLKNSILSFCQCLEFSLTLSRGIRIFLLLALFSLAAKLWMASLGQTFDFGSYELVAGIMEKGGDVYGETHRYNYGPVWFHILHFLKQFSGEYFRYAIPLFLGLADIGLGAFLWKLKYRIASLLFLLSPLSCYITGFHRQFDNFAIFFASLALLALMVREEEKISLPRTILAGFLLGFSIVIKHVFIFFPFWLLFRKYDLKRQCILFFLPLSMFALSFVPYFYPFWKVTEKEFKEDCRILKIYAKEYLERNMESANMKDMILTHANGRFAPAYGIIKNVFLYKSGEFQVLLKTIVPGVFHPYIPIRLLFFGGILLAGYLLRRRTLFEYFLFYTLWLFLLSPAMADQYLAIPLLFTCVNYLPFGFLYSLYAGLALMIDRKRVAVNDLYEVSTFILLLILLYMYKEKVAAFLEKTAKFLRKV